MKNAEDKPKTISLTVPHEFHFCTDTRVRAHELDSNIEATDKVGNYTPTHGISVCIVSFSAPET